MRISDWSSDVCSSDLLLEGIGTLGWSGLSPHWPVSFTADYVKNLGAAVSGDAAFNVELAAGRTAEPGDWRLSYNYSEVEVDSVLAAFSHDHTIGRAACRERVGQAV